VIDLFQLQPTSVGGTAPLRLRAEAQRRGRANTSPCRGGVLVGGLRLPTPTNKSVFFKKINFLSRQATPPSQLYYIAICSKPNSFAAPFASRPSRCLRLCTRS